jgi:Uncharacterised protein conserved in bacteria (DUF2336)
MADRSLIAEIEGAFASGSAEKQVEILRRVTDLFLAGADKYSDGQVDLFDGVISRLAERIETKARAELANRLAPVANAPLTTVRTLARDESIEVAGPILSRSNRLTDEDLLAIAKDNSQECLLAISKRATLSENVSDVLVTRGNRDVVLSVTQNEGARFSDTGYEKLVDKSIDDEVLAICVGMRKDIPREHFHILISKASEVVFERLAASNPAAVFEVQSILAGITGQETPAKPKAKRDYREAEAQFDIIQRSGKPVDPVVLEFAASGDFEKIVAALSALCHAPSELVENVMDDRRGDNDLPLLLAKAAGLSWPTARQLCILRRGTGGLSSHAIEAARLSFERLQTATAQRAVRFYNQRHAAATDFQRLARHIREEEGGPRLPRFSGASPRS